MTERICAALLMLFSCCLTAFSGDGPVESGFRSPPQEARPRVWWHWEDGNVTRDGIRKDLEWMHRVGIGGYHHFDAGISQKPVVEHRLVYMHEDWKDAFRYALELSDSLGMSVGIASSPGWSNTGGPWVSRDDAMKKLVWTSVDLPEGRCGIKLPRPSVNLDYYRDIRVLAFRLPESDGLVRSVKVLGNSGRPMWNILPYESNLALECSDDGKRFRQVAIIPRTTAESITVNLSPVEAGEFRLRDIIDSTRAVPEFILYEHSRINHSEEKSGFSSPYDLADFRTELSEGEIPAKSCDVIDLTESMDSAGYLSWNVPEGKWRVLRMGYTLTGRCNGPAPKEATGLEVDKLDSAAYRNYFITYLDMYRNASHGMMGSKGITELLVDSYEAGWQTWTPDMPEQFEKRRGYSLVPWLPVLTGEVLDDAAASEKFLFDWRKTIGELHAANYAQIKDIAKLYGIETLCLESQENGRVFNADGMDIKRYADVPMAACWTEVDFPTAHSTRPVAVADIRESASLAHLYGKRWVAAESFTADGTEGSAFAFVPSGLKRLADLEFASGVNRVFIHESSHQPLDDCKPGLGLLIYGQWFTRNETWAELASAWTDYLARTSYMMSLGSNVADILVYYGEDTNLTARYGKDSFPVPDGYNYDFINSKGLFDISVENGLLAAPSGNTYRVLCLDMEGLPQSEEIMERISELKAAGATVCTVDNLAEEVSGIDRDVDGPSCLRFVHRRYGDYDIYWVDNPTDDAVNSSVRFNTAGMEPRLWNPENGEIHPVSYKRNVKNTDVILDLGPDDAVFVVFGPKKAKRSYLLPERKKPASVDIKLTDWTMNFPFGTVKIDTLADYTSFDDADIKYFSGSCIYSTTFDIKEIPSDAILSLGKVCDLCRVKVNGKDAGILWREPFVCNVAGLLEEGGNTLEIEVVNTWVNRLVGDKQPDCRRVTTYTTGNFYKADSELHPAGLLGPVTLQLR